eukprot:CAMPEP_0183735952 /NCGR_PEP_ID=MMETSP0737-20130205/48053_1 /TAXON_ID=385413 /ORGANISM="Thalassiosira miniscula, Strain CCMP1093" /LENGTH=130 /DNA_ID=CAMNT_0025969833 /DNA_START=11 /DNA_END=403 /DNA_ORIENTATION=-
MYGHDGDRSESCECPPNYFGVQCEQQLSAQPEPSLSPASSLGSLPTLLPVPSPTPFTPASPFGGDETLSAENIFEESASLQSTAQPNADILSVTSPNVTALNSTVPMPSSSPVMLTMVPTPEDEIDFATS